MGNNLDERVLQILYSIASATYDRYYVCETCIKATIGHNEYCPKCGSPVNNCMGDKI
jgi:rRNA maturation endonuclease Nob1